MSHSPVQVLNFGMVSLARQSNDGTLRFDLTLADGKCRQVVERVANSLHRDVDVRSKSSHHLELRDTRVQHLPPSKRTAHLNQVISDLLRSIERAAENHVNGVTAAEPAPARGRSRDRATMRRSAR